MKPIYLAFIFLLLSVSCWANRVDSINTDSDALEFINSLLDKEYKGKANFPDRKNLLIDKRILQMVGAENWYKADISGDGLTDFLANFAVDGFGCYAFIDDGKGSFKTLNLEYSFFGGREIATVTSIDGTPKILFYAKRSTALSPGSANQLKRDTITIDTLTYKFGEFIEYNPKPSNKQLTEIMFRTGQCFGECPVFSITLHADGAATYTGGKYNEDKGDFKGDVRREDLTPFFDLVKYIDIDKLKSKYTTNWTDDTTYWLTIKFADGTTKKIEDYAGLGTFGLRALYSKFFRLKKDQIWYEQ